MERSKPNRERCDEKQVVTRTAEKNSARGIIIVDDHPIFRAGLSQIIDLETDLEVRAQADSSLTALELIRCTCFDLAIVDIGLEGRRNGIELTNAIKVEHPNLPVLVLSMHEQSFHADRALRAGASGYLIKREAPHLVISAIREVLGGRIYVSPQIQKHLTTLVTGDRKSSEALKDLTDREREILQLLGGGRGVREIAHALQVSPKTVEAHRCKIKQKLNMKSSRDVARYATNWVNAQC
jgi:DNA-binding NarL/FixJ family response regulator